MSLIKLFSVEISCFQVQIEWSKFLGRVGENGIEIGLENGFLRTKTQKGISGCLHRRNDHAPLGTGHACLFG